MAMEIFKELAESRAIRSDKNISKTMDANDIAENIYTHILSLQSMRNDPQYAEYVKKYARDTMKYNGFSHIRHSSTDLHNLISILNNPEKYGDKIGPIGRTTIPELQLKTYLRNIQRGRNDPGFDSRFLMNLERSLGIKQARLKSTRRLVGSWDKLHGRQQKTAVTNLIRNIRHEMPRSDIRGNFERFTKQRGMEIKDTPKKMNKFARAGLIAGGSFAAGYGLSKALSGGAYTDEKHS